MNKLEAEYALYLEGLKRSEEILDYSFEPLRLILADRTTYSPDFMLIMQDLSIEMHEVKAVWSGKKTPHVEDDAAVKLKVAAVSFPFTFVLVWKGDGWQKKIF